MKRLSDDPAVRLAECQNMADAYVGAREDVAIWKRRTLEAEEKLRVYGDRVVDLGVLGMQAAVRKPAFDEAAELVKFEAFYVEKAKTLPLPLGNSPVRYAGGQYVNDFALFGWMVWLACAKSRTEQSK